VKGKKRKEKEKEKKARLINLLGELSSIVRSREDRSQWFDVVKPTGDPSVVLVLYYGSISPTWCRWVPLSLAGILSGLISGPR